MPPWARDSPQHVLHALDEVDDLGAGELVGRPGAVQPGPPQRLVGVDVAHPADQRLVQQGPLDLGVPPAQGRGEGVDVEVLAPAGRPRCAAAGAGRPVGSGVLDGQPAEGALVDEAQLTAAVGEGEPGPQVLLRAARSAPRPAADRSCPGGRPAPGRSAAPSRASGSHRYLPRRWAAVTVAPVRSATKSSAPSRCRRTARGCRTSRWRRCGRRPSAPDRAGPPRPRAARARPVSPARCRSPTGRARRSGRPSARRPSWSGRARRRGAARPAARWR